MSAHSGDFRVPAVAGSARICERVPPSLETQTVFPIKESVQVVIKISRNEEGGNQLIDRSIGVIVIDKNGRIGLSYNTPKMVRAYFTERMDRPIAAV